MAYFSQLPFPSEPELLWNAAMPASIPPWEMRRLPMVHYIAIMRAATDS